MGGRGLRWLVVVALATTALVLTARPAHACSCGPSGAPEVDFTGVAVEDLGYHNGDPGTATGEEHAWLLDVEDARAGVGSNVVRISMAVGEFRDGDSWGINTCGLDDNLVVGERYDVLSGGLDHMITCGSSVTGPRAPVPDRSEGGDPTLLYVAGVGAVLLLAGLAVALARSRANDS